MNSADEDEPMKFLLSVSPSKEMENRTRQEKNLRPRRESNPRPPELIIRCSARPDGSKWWVIMVVIAAM